MEGERWAYLESAVTPATSRSGARRATLLRVGVAAALTLGAFAVLTVGIYFGYATRIGAAVDLFLPWWALHAALASGQTPYSEAIGLAARAARFYGAPPPLPEHPYRFAYPLYFALAIAPLMPLPYPWAAAAWMALLALATPALTLLLCRELGWPRTPAGRALAAVAGTVFYPSLLSIVLGQITAIALLLLVGAQAAARQASRRRHLVAGALLAAATVKPQVVWLAAPLVLLDAARAGRRWLLAGFGATLGALVALSVAWVPAWPVEFLASLGGYTADEPTPSALLLLAHRLLHGRFAGAWEGAPAPLAIAGGGALVGGTMLWWWRRQPDGLHTLVVALAVTLAVTPLRAQTAQVALLLPLFWTLRSVALHAGSAAAAALATLVLAGGWTLIVSRSDPPDYWLRQVLPPLAGLVLAGGPYRLRQSLRPWAPPYAVPRRATPCRTPVPPAEGAPARTLFAREPASPASRAGRPYRPGPLPGAPDAQSPVALHLHCAGKCDRD